MYNTVGKDLATVMKEKNLPGVFAQGLVVYAGAGDDVIFERLLDAEIVALVSTFAEERGMTIIGYSGDRIVSFTMTQVSCIVTIVPTVSTKTTTCCR